MKLVFKNTIDKLLLIFLKDLIDFLIRNDQKRIYLVFQVRDSEKFTKKFLSGLHDFLNLNYDLPLNNNIFDRISINSGMIAGEINFVFNYKALIYNDNIFLCDKSNYYGISYHYKEPVKADKYQLYYKTKYRREKIKKILCG